MRNLKSKKLAIALAVAKKDAFLSLKSDVSKYKTAKLRFSLKIGFWAKISEIANQSNTSIENVLWCIDVSFVENAGCTCGCGGDFYDIDDHFLGKDYIKQLPVYNSGLHFRNR